MIFNSKKLRLIFDESAQKNCAKTKLECIAHFFSTTLRLSLASFHFGTHTERSLDQNFICFQAIVDGIFIQLCVLMFVCVFFSLTNLAVAIQKIYLVRVQMFDYSCSSYGILVFFRSPFSECKHSFDLLVPLTINFLSNFMCVLLLPLFHITQNLSLN